MFAAKDMLLAGALAPVIFDATGAGGAVNPAASVSWSHTATAGAAVVVGVASDNTGTGTYTCTYGGTTMTVLSNFQYYNDGTNFQYLTAFGLLNVPGGAKTVLVTPNHSSYMTANSVSYLHVFGFGSPATASGNGATESISTSATQGLVFNLLANFNPSGNATGNITGYTQTQRYNHGGASNNEPLVIGDAVFAPSISFSGTSVSTHWGAMTVPLL